LLLHDGESPWMYVLVTNLCNFSEFTSHSHDPVSRQNKAKRKEAKRIC
jgi:hypothetical protein